jgi:hypothetical protein
MKSTLNKQWASLQSIAGEKRIRSCNICSAPFDPKTPFDRYCLNCKEHSELLKFSEWLPELDSELELNLIA